MSRAASIACMLAAYTLLSACAGTTPSPEALPGTASEGFAPGMRVLLDAHNAYPERGKWGDRLRRALESGLPLAIEQDLYWYRNPATGTRESVVAHDNDALAGAPTLESYLFDAVRPIMERALVQGRREDWPLVTLNLDFKSNEREHHEAVWALLTKHERWLTTAPRTSTPDERASMSVGPMLVLTGSDARQRQRFHDDVRIGNRLLLFGAVPVPAPVGLTRAARARTLARLAPSRLIPARAANYSRWVNFSWLAVEEGGASAASDWTARDSSRLVSLVQRAHRRGYWVRFYTLDGFPIGENAGYSPEYNFGAHADAALRWRAAIDAGVDFVATDQYEWFAALRAGR